MIARENCCTRRYGVERIDKHGITRWGSNMRAGRRVLIDRYRKARVVFDMPCGTRRIYGLGCGTTQGDVHTSDMFAQTYQEPLDNWDAATMAEKGRRAFVTRDPFTNIELSTGMTSFVDDIARGMFVKNAEDAKR